MIPEDQLEEGAWYYGHGRLGPVAKYKDNHFLSVDYSCGFDQLGSMDYIKGFLPYAVIDRSFTPEVLKMVNDAMDSAMGMSPLPIAPRITSLQELSVIQQFLIKFMEVGTYQLNVETQAEVMRLALGKIAGSRTDDANELRSLARDAFIKMSSLRRS